METINTQSKVLRLKSFVWLQMAFHVCFILSATLTPSIVTANEELRFLQRPAGQSGLQTQDYVLSPGETTASVAKKFNISLDELRKLNQFRTYARDFEQLQPGEKLEVPLAPVQWDEPGQKATPAPLKQDDTQAKKIAGLASQTGSQLSNNKSSDAASSLARGMVTNEANVHIQQWLSQFGTARVRLNADENLNLKNSQVDLLVPLYDQQDKLFFTQGSLHRTDDRTQSNVGLGLRWFNDDWMLGGNTFLDYDLLRDHARMGVGIEYWRDFMKLGANSYHRLTGWKDSPDFADFQERPASDWDIRAQGWLPGLPQWGGALTFEQYYGNDVALFGKNNRQRDP
ncbi:inverse autotransporter beta domain-containing protein [Candidatus Symbiopectobacterium endolongispinus]|nr:LysM peptidoglycan-binding domain-containing protein [Candidatus Symbiopectobacterium sp. PLON1]MBT9428965.1 inverse autotransporter beta domain-containing protein [Candidatus Symbiopectobacterium endolongispinus]